MRTIFITSFHLLTPRNILWTPVLDILLKSDIKVVLLVPKQKEDYYKKSFQRQNLIIEGIAIGGDTRTFRDRLFGRIFHAMNETTSMRIRYRAEFRGRPFSYFFKYLLINYIGRLRFVRKILRYCDYLLLSENRFQVCFDRYSPDLIFSTDIIDKYDVALIYAAWRRKIPVVSMVRSWDNLTKFGTLRAIPDQLLVWNEILKSQAIRYHDVPQERISIVGLSHYDFYTHGKRTPRNEFLRELDIDPSKKIILYSPTGAPRLLCGDADKYILGILEKLDATIIVRFPPSNPVDMDGYKKPANVIYDIPGVVFGRTPTSIDCIIEAEDDRRFADELYYADLVVCGPTTVALDAAVFDKPTILVNFNSHQAPFLDDLWESYHSEHLEPLIKSQAARLVGSEKELLYWVQKYLDNPQIDSGGRKKLVESHCGALDGKASERMARELIQIFL